LVFIKLGVMNNIIYINNKLKKYESKEDYLVDLKLRSFLLEILEHIENALNQSFINEKNVPGIKRIFQKK